MNNLLFGTAGIPHSTLKPSTIEGIKQIKKLNLDCMELEFVQGIYLSEEKTLQVKKIAEKFSCLLSAHAPYYINLNSRDNQKLLASKKRILQSAKIAYLAGAKNLVFHCGFFLGDDKKIVYEKIKNELTDIVNELQRNNINIILRPELTGKESQFGSLEEILNLSCEIKNVLPCIDFSHHYARTIGKQNTYKEFLETLKKIKKCLGEEALKNLHVHIAGIQFGQKGEIRHLNLKQSGFNYKDLLLALKNYNVGGTVICESPNLEQDAKLLKKIWESIS